jgi:16S rRNA processing protein RimM
MKTLRAKARGKPEIELEVISVKPHEGKGQLLVTVRGIEDRDAAEALRGRVITVAPDERVELPEGEYWIDSLIGLDVIETGGRHLGIIEDVLTTGSSDIYQVRADDGTLKMIPAIEDVVREISLNDGAVKVDLLEGLWD